MLEYQNKIYLQVHKIGNLVLPRISQLETTYKGTRVPPKEFNQNHGGVVSNHT